MNTDQISPLMTNEELDTWADIYAQARLAELVDVQFSKFLEAPFAYLAAAGQDTALDCMINGSRPLLPAQARAANRIRADWGERDSTVVKSRSHLSLVVN